MPGRVFDGHIRWSRCHIGAGGAREVILLRPFVAIIFQLPPKWALRPYPRRCAQPSPRHFCIDRAGIVGEDGATHHGAFDLAYLRTVPASSFPPVATRPRSATSCSPPRKPTTAPFSPSASARTRSGRRLAYRLPQHARGPRRMPHAGARRTVPHHRPGRRRCRGCRRPSERGGYRRRPLDMIFLKPLDDSIISAVAEAGCPSSPLRQAQSTAEWAPPWPNVLPHSVTVHRSYAWACPTVSSAGNTRTIASPLRFR